MKRIRKKPYRKSRLTILRERYGNDEEFKSLTDKLLKGVRGGFYTLDDLYGSLCIINTILKSDSCGHIVGNRGGVFGVPLDSMETIQVKALVAESRYRPYAIAELRKRKE